MPCISPAHMCHAALFFPLAFCVDRNIATGGALFARPRRQPVSVFRRWRVEGLGEIVGGLEGVIKCKLFFQISYIGEDKSGARKLLSPGSDRSKDPIKDKTETPGGVLRCHATASGTAPPHPPPAHAVRLTSAQPSRPARTSLCSSNKRSKDGARENKKFTAERFMSARRYGCRTCMGGVVGVRGDA